MFKSFDNNNNNNNNNTRTMFMLLSSCCSSIARVHPGSRGERSTAPGGRRPATIPLDRRQNGYV